MASISSCSLICFHVYRISLLVIAICQFAMCIFTTIVTIVLYTSLFHKPESVECELHGDSNLHVVRKSFHWRCYMYVATKMNDTCSPIISLSASFSRRISNISDKIMKYLYNFIFDVLGLSGSVNTLETY